jgi:hypothetical protein
MDVRAVSGEADIAARVIPDFRSRVTHLHPAVTGTEVLGAAAKDALA